MTKRGIVVMVVLTALSALGALRAGQVVGVSRVGILDYTGLASAPTNPPTSLGRVFYNSTAKALQCLNSDGTACLATASGGSPGGSAGDIQFKCGSVFGNANCVNSGDQANDVAGAIVISGGAAMTLNGTTGVTVEDTSGPIVINAGGDSSITLNQPGMILSEGSGGIIELSTSGGANSGIEFVSQNLNATGANGELDLGAAAVGFGGVLGLNGPTSGKCTLTANATGTSLASSCPITGLTAPTLDAVLNPVANVSFTAPATDTYTFQGTAPASGSGAGTAAGTTFTFTAPAGGATTGSATTGGVGGSFALTTGAGGSGSGGTNANGGAGGAFSITLGAGGTASGAGTAGVQGAFTFSGLNFSLSGGTLTFGSVGSNAVLTGNGSTSGSWTVTGPAVAGTTKNPIAFSNAISLPAGSAAAPSICVTGTQCTNDSGIYFSGGAIGITNSGTPQQLFNFNVAPEFVQDSTAIIDWTNSSSSPTATVDTGICRASAGTIEITTSTTCGAGGSLTATNLTGSGTVRANTSFNANGTAGLSSSGVLCTATFTSVLGIVTACTAVSDPLVKMNIQPFMRGLSDILKIDPISFNYNAEGQKITGLSPGVMEYGFSAKNIQQAIPEAVGIETHDGVGYLSLPQGDRPIVAALVNAVKEQQNEIEQLTKEVEALKAHH